MIDFFLSETAHHADVVFAGSLQEEEEGVVCSAEGPRSEDQQSRRSAGRSASRTRGSSAILPASWASGKYFDFASTQDIFEELRRASQGGIADYYGITWERIEQELGVFWPCPSLDHPGTPRLFEDGKFLPSRRQGALSNDRMARDRRSARRRVSRSSSPPAAWSTMYLSGTQTRRIGPLVEQYPEPQA